MRATAEIRRNSLLIADTDPFENFVEKGISFVFLYQKLKTIQLAGRAFNLVRPEHFVVLTPLLPAKPEDKLIYTFRMRNTAHLIVQKQVPVFTFEERRSYCS